jgi:hypothetical protein
VRSVFLSVFVALTACGYQVLRADRPFGAARLTLIPFAEDVPVGLSPDLALALGRELAAQGVALTLDPAVADMKLSGRVVTSSTLRSPAAGVGAPVPAYDIRVQILATLVDRAGKQLWATQVDASEGFLPSVTPSDNTLLETEANRRRALLRLADTAAHAIVERLAVASAAATPGGV